MSLPLITASTVYEYYYQNDNPVPIYVSGNTTPGMGIKWYSDESLTTLIGQSSGEYYTSIIPNTNLSGLHNYYVIQKIGVDQSEPVLIQFEIFKTPIINVTDIKDTNTNDGYIKFKFNAILDASIKLKDAYGNLLNQKNYNS